MLKMTLGLCASLYLVLMVFGGGESAPIEAAQASVPANRPTTAAGVIPVKLEALKKVAATPFEPVQITEVKLVSADATDVHDAQFVTRLRNDSIAITDLPKPRDLPPIREIKLGFAPLPTAPEPVIAADTDLVIATVTGNRVNLRAGAATSFGVIGTAVKGQQLGMIETLANGWTKVVVQPSGEHAYISSQFLNM